MDASALLREVPFFSAVSDEDRDALALLLGVRCMAPGEALYRQGADGDSMAVIGRGELAVRVARDDGGEVEVARIPAGQVIGEMACISPGPRSASVVAADFAEILEIDRATLLALQTSAPSVAATIVGSVIRQLTDRLQATTEKIQQAGGAEKGSSAESAVAVEDAAVTPGTPVDSAPLQGLAALGDLTPAGLAVLERSTRAMGYPAGSILARERTTGHSCYLLVRGEVELVKTVGGTERVLTSLGPGSFVGQMYLVQTEVRPASVRARSHCIVRELTRDDFERLLATGETIALRLQERIAVAGIRQLRSATETLAKVLEATAPVAAPAAPAAPAEPDLDDDDAALELALAVGDTLEVDFDAQSLGDWEDPRAAKAEEDRGMALAFLETALGEWDVSVDDLELAVDFDAPML